MNGIMVNFGNLKSKILMTHKINTKHLNFNTVSAIIHEDKKLVLSKETIANISNCRSYLDTKLKDSKEPIYGINTGFGSLCNVKISDKNLSELQENLVLSHACGTGDIVPKTIVKLMLFFKIQSLGYGYSGVQLKTVERLVDFYNNNILPVVYTQGSLGASGDLAPLAHMALPLLGKGRAFYKNKEYSGAEILKMFNWQPIKLKAKEGLALLNGTQFMSAYGTFLLLKAFKLSYFADLIGTLSLEAFNGIKAPFNALIHLIRPHKGQLKTAERILEFLDGSQLINQPKAHVQDPYSFRCMPQVHGATKDTLDFVSKTFLTEINSVTDNPNIFVKADEIISGGNFHGQPLALALDFLSIAMAELGSISERRIFQLISGQRSLPAFLVKNPGLNSGFMIPQYTAASIVSQNKQLSTPASVDSIVSSNGQEDHVSMGANAATKAYKVIENLETILAIELLNASQALSFRKLKTSPFLFNFITLFRKSVKLIENDIEMAPRIAKSKDFINDFYLEPDILDY